MEILQELLKEQGLVATIMIAGIWFFYRENRSLVKKNEELHNDIIEEYKEARITNLKIITENTQAFKENTRVVEQFLNSKK